MYSCVIIINIIIIIIIIIAIVVEQVLHVLLSCTLHLVKCNAILFFAICTSTSTSTSAGASTIYIYFIIIIIFLFRGFVASRRLSRFGRDL